METIINPNELMEYLKQKDIERFHNLTGTEQQIYQILETGVGEGNWTYDKHYWLITAMHNTLNVWCGFSPEVDTIPPVLAWDDHYEEICGERDCLTCFPTYED